jgi:hypothetical protein
VGIFTEEFETRFESKQTDSNSDGDDAEEGKKEKEEASNKEEVISENVNAEAVDTDEQGATNTKSTLTESK